MMASQRLLKASSSIGWMISNTVSDLMSLSVEPEQLNEMVVAFDQVAVMSSSVLMAVALSVSITVSFFWILLLSEDISTARSMILSTVESSFLKYSGWPWSTGLYPNVYYALNNPGRIHRYVSACAIFP